MKTIVFTGGGTAGHVTPNLALISKFDPDEWDIHYIGSKNGIEKDLIAPLSHVSYHGVSSGKLRRYFSLENVSDVFRVIAGYFQSKRLIKEIRPDVVFSKGGYVSVPVVAAAAGKCPVICHESDYSPGLANRIASRFADLVCVTFEDTVPQVKHGDVRCTGTPVRQELFTGNKERGYAFTGFTGEKPILLVMGGSQGAQAVNDCLRNALPELCSRFDIIHLCGRGKLDPSADRPGYRQYEYISEELKDLFAVADIVLSRSGANSVFELLALHKPSLLIPLPLEASRGDQVLNATYFEKNGFAKKLDQADLTPERLVSELTSVWNARQSYIEAMRKYPNTDGTETIYRLIMDAVR